MAAPDEPDVTTLRVQRAKAGEAESLEWVVERFTPLLLEQARHRIGSALRRQIEPEDLVQEVWAVALPGLASLSTRAGRATPVLLRFLSATLLYRLNNHARRAIRRRELAGAEPGRAAPDWEQLSAHTRGAVARAASGEARAELARALAALSPRDREVIVLRGIEQLDNRRAAEVLGETPNAVSLRFGRALAELRRALPGSLLDELE